MATPGPGGQASRCGLPLWVMLKAAQWSEGNDQTDSMA